MCGETTNNKIHPYALPPIHINDTVVGMLSLKVFLFHIIMCTYWIFNKYLCIPSEFVIILYYLYNNYSALIGDYSHQLFLDYPLEDINIMSKNNHQPLSVLLVIAGMTTISSSPALKQTMSLGGSHLYNGCYTDLR